MKTMLIEKGAKLWEAGDKKRVYLDRNMVNKIFGLKYSLYNSGKISSATYEGETISNSAALKIIDATEKVYYDAIAEKFIIQINWGSPAVRNQAANYERWLNKLSVEEIAQKL